jgi:hypothetical protein
MFDAHDCASSRVSNVVASSKVPQTPWTRPLYVGRVRNRRLLDSRTTYAVIVLLLLFVMVIWYSFFSRFTNLNHLDDLAKIFWKVGYCPDVWPGRSPAYNGSFLRDAGVHSCTII